MTADTTVQRRFTRASPSELIAVAARMLVHGRLRAVLTLCGVGATFFLAAAQVGLMVGWCDTCSAVVRNANVDVWLMAEKTPAFDYGTAIPKRRLYQSRSVPGVRAAEAMIMTWVFWQLPGGRRQNVELVGLDHKLLGAPWQMLQGTVESVRDPDSVIVDELYEKRLGVGKIGDEIEISGRRAVVGAISHGVRTLTAAPFAFTSMRSALRYEPRYGVDDITYVLVQGDSSIAPEMLRDRVAAAVPGVEVLTTREFAIRTIRYWMLETGLGITVVLTAILGLGVSVVISSQTLFTVTQEHLGSYAMLSAIGFSRAQLVGCVLLQTMILSGTGIAIGSCLFFFASAASVRTPIPLETTPAIFAGVVTLSVLSSLAASYLSVKAVLSVDPVTVFRA